MEETMRLRRDEADGNYKIPGGLLKVLCMGTPRASSTIEKW